MNGFFKLIPLMACCFLAGCLGGDDGDSGENVDIPSEGTPNPSACAYPVTSSDQGTLSIGPSSDIESICGRLFVISNKSTNQIKFITLPHGNEVGSFQLSSTPGDIEYDATNNLVYITLSPANKLAIVNLNNETLEYMTLRTAPLDIALNVSGGKIFVSLDDTLDWPDRPINLIDPISKTVVKQWIGDYYSHIVYDPTTEKLYSGAQGLSPATLQAFKFDGADNSLTFLEDSRDLGSNAYDLDVSINGNIAFVCGSGNGSGYTVYDIAPNGLSSIEGEWVTGAYPSAGEFSDDGKKILLTDRERLMVFDATTHVMQDEYNYSICSYGDIESVAMSADQKAIVGISYCGFDKDSGELYWKTVK